MSDERSNSGDYNSGDYNSGNYNSGYRNSGDRNSGDYNSGYRNSGYRNSGNYNSGDRNSGYFCTETPQPTFFDQSWEGTWEDAYELIPHLPLPVCCEWVSEKEMSDKEKAENPNYTTIGGYLKSNPLPLNEAFPVAWEQASEETRQRFIDLPNFDPEKFLAITGVDVRTDEYHLKGEREITMDGQRYRLVPID